MKISVMSKTKSFYNIKFYTCIKYVLIFITNPNFLFFSHSGYYSSCLIVSFLHACLSFFLFLFFPHFSFSFESLSLNRAFSTIIGLRLHWSLLGSMVGTQLKTIAIILLVANILASARSTPWASSWSMTIRSCLM